MVFSFHSEWRWTWWSSASPKQTAGQAVVGPCPQGRPGLLTSSLEPDKWGFSPEGVARLFSSQKPTASSEAPGAPPSASTCGGGASGDPPPPRLGHRSTWGANAMHSGPGQEGVQDTDGAAWASQPLPAFQRLFTHRNHEPKPLVHLDSAISCLGTCLRKMVRGAHKPLLQRKHIPERLLPRCFHSRKGLARGDRDLRHSISLRGNHSFEGYLKLKASQVHMVSK